MRFALSVNGQAHTVSAPPLKRLLDILRDDLGLFGTKEGCGEGECGACAVLLDGRLVNACLVPALQLPGRDVRTIEGLGSAEEPDPVQKAFMQEGAAQCGFCIPGMVMAGRALLNKRPRPSRDEVRRALAGNLCRCTGYERIFRAIDTAAAWEEEDRGGPAQEVVPTVRGVTKLADALEMLEAHGESVTIVAGATDLFVDLKLGAVKPERLLDVTGIEELGRIREEDEALVIGAAVTFAQCLDDPLMQARYPAVCTMAAEVGAVAIQNRATVGGNIISASPAADASPVLMALGATLRLYSAAGERRIPLPEFYTGYRQIQRRPDELLAAIELPKPGARSRQAFYKVGTRRAQAISKVTLAGVASLDKENRLGEVCLAAGSMAATPVLLPTVADRVTGRQLLPDTLASLIAEAGEVTRQAVKPIDDVRSTARYRAETLAGLVGRFLTEICERELPRDA